MLAKGKIIIWAPRILCIGAILFVSMFALDSFEPGIPIGQQLLNFLVHMIPSIGLVLMLAVAWNRPLIGGILFIVAGIALSPFVFQMNLHRTHSLWVSLSVILMITFPFIIAGILFILSYLQHKKCK